MTDFTKQTKSISEKSIKRDWYLVDVKGKILGRVIRDVVNHLTGKNKVNYVSYLDSGDNVVVINASGVKLSGKKMETKIYTNYSGYPSGLRTVSIQKLFQTRPQEIITQDYLFFQVINTVTQISLRSKVNPPTGGQKLIWLKK